MSDKKYICWWCLAEVYKLDEHGTCGNLNCIDAVKGTNELLLFCAIVFVGIPLFTLLMIYGVKWT